MVEYFWIAFVVGFVLLVLALICRAVSGQDKRLKSQQPLDVGDEASIASESSQTNDVDSANAAQSRWFRRPTASPQASIVPIAYASTSTAAMAPLAPIADEKDIGAQTPSQRQINPCDTKRSLSVTPRISPENPLHSQRGLHRSKFTFDEMPSQPVQALADNCVERAAPEIMRSISWEQSLRRWTLVILASNTGVPDQSETSV